MQQLTLPVVAKRYSSKIGKTAIECSFNNTIITVFANGDCESSPALLCNIVINEVGDKFVATSDSKTMGENGTPVYKKGDTVTRQKPSTEFKSLAGENQAAQFAQAANAFGLKLIVQM